PVEPGIKPTFAAVVGDAAVDRDEHLLGDVLGLLAIADHPVDEAEDPILVGVDELLKGPLVTLFEPPDQPPIAGVAGGSGLFALVLGAVASVGPGLLCRLARVRVL